MRKPDGHALACVLALVAVSVPIAAFQSPKPAASSILAVAAGAPTRNFLVFYYDDKFLFGGRHYGAGRDFAGPTEPALLVHSKAHDRWIEITAISTKDAKLGRSTADMVVSVVWDFTPYASRPFIEQPLKTPGSVMFPDRIDYDDASGRYVLRHASKNGIPIAETVLYIRGADLVESFNRISK